jgi:2-polyprenyl-3-methyl-5-hydroxy-6-metoxy-1,4-benzoquinol methylase
MGRSCNVFGVSCLYVGTRRSALASVRTPLQRPLIKFARPIRTFVICVCRKKQRLALLNAKWRLALIQKKKSSGRLLEVGCARGDFLRVARDRFDVCGVEPNPELADSAAQVAPVYRDVIERTSWNGFDVVASFHVIEHVDSPRSFIAARWSV